jgi:hypothetical protein
MKNLDGKYADWMVSVNNEISETPAAIRPFRLPPRQPSSQSVDDNPRDTIR